MGAEFEKQVSVIMGVYNQWKREALQKAVKSILNQTLTDFEFIIYDDGSDPEVAGYIRELEKLDERIVLIGKEENHGLAFSLNMCIGIALFHPKYQQYPVFHIYSSIFEPNGQIVLHYFLPVCAL